MAAVTTDIPNRWRGAYRPRHLTVLPPPTASPVRVTPAAYHRRRVLAAVVVVALLLAAWAALEVLAGALGISEAPAPSPTSPVPSTVEVAPGDTFWSIASRLDPRGDPRPLVDRLVAAHGGGALQAGEHLVVPPG